MAWRGEAWQGEVEVEVEVGARRHTERGRVFVRSPPPGGSAAGCCLLLLLVQGLARTTVV